MSEVEKLVFENPDFKFGIAYDTYLKRFNEVSDDEERTRLNNAITELHEGKLSYPAFYASLNPSDERSRRYHRMQISSSRKRAYRTQERKVDRIKRHK